MDDKLYRKILAMAPLFRSLSHSELADIVSISKLLKVKKGVTVVEEGDEGAAMYILVDGRAEVLKKLPGGENTHLANLKAPSVFGEMALIDRHPRSASVVTLTDSVLFQINLQAFNRLRDKYHSGVFKVLREIAPTLCERLREENERIGEFFKNPEQNYASIEEQVLDASSGREPAEENE